MMVLFIWSAILGFFNSNNDLVKALAAIILIHITSMMSFGLPDYSVQYIVIWISVSACFSSELRKITNVELSESFNSYF